MKVTCPLESVLPLRSQVAPLRLNVAETVAPDIPPDPSKIDTLLSSSPRPLFLWVRSMAETQMSSEPGTGVGVFVGVGSGVGGTGVSVGVGLGPGVAVGVTELPAPSMVTPT